jgi:PIN domain nuclease of toxin-antitoxin system
MLLLDTDTLIWWLLDDKRLGVRSRSLIRLTARGKLAVSVATWMELGHLQRRADIRFRETIPTIRKRVIEGGMVEREVTGAVALDAADLSELSPNPMDRLLAATARQSGATLVTSDDRILGWDGTLDRLDARI